MLLSPGVEVIEIDASLTVSTAGSSFACYVGNFETGPADGAVLITSIQMLIDTFGYPTNQNYNDWYQCWTFLRYSGSLYVCRLVDRNGENGKVDSGNTIDAANSIGDMTLVVNASTGLYANQFITIGADTTVYQIESINQTTITLFSALESVYNVGDKVYICNPSYNAMGEAEVQGGTAIPSSSLMTLRQTIANVHEYDVIESSLAFSNIANSKFQFIAKNPGYWGDAIEIAIANPSDFVSGSTEVFTGIALNDLFSYFPVTGQLGIVIRDAGVIVETFTVSLDPTSKDYNNKSNYIENVLNTQSNYVFCKDNTTLTSCASKLGANVVTLALGADGNPGKAEVIEALNDHFADKESIDIDIVIANELANKECADFGTTRGDVIVYVGALQDDVVGKKSTDAVANLVAYCTTGDFNVSSSFAAFIGNRIQVYDMYNDTNRWINCAGAVAGLRANTTNNFQMWISESGLNRGVLKDIVKIAQSFSVGARDLLYKNSINCIVNFPGQGTVLWGSKTTLKKQSAFNQIGTRGLFNYLERNISKSAKYVVFEQNDTITQNMFVSMVKPLFDYVKAARGLTDYMIDLSGNTPLAIQNNQFVCNFLIKPTYTINFITLKFTAVGPTQDFSIVSGA